MTFAEIKSPTADLENDIPLLGDSTQRPADNPITTLETMLNLNLGLQVGEAALDAIADAGDMVEGFFEGVMPEILGTANGGITCTGMSPEPAMVPALAPSAPGLKAVQAMSGPDFKF
jgi:hypothetical protein